jgi:glycosyltransferase involved in cell wall biosynthesis
MKLSLVIPCFNEAGNLETLISRCREGLAGADAEVVLVDNGSTDASAEILANTLSRDTLIRSVRVEENQGYGFGVLSGLAASRGEFLAWTHADLQTDPADARKALDLALSAPNPECVFVKGDRRGRALFDVAFSIGMAAFETALLGRVFWDINAQPTLFHRRFFQSWRDPPRDFSLDLYAYHLAKSQGLDVRRFDVRFPKRLSGVSHWNTSWASKLKFIRRTLSFSFELKRRLRDV